MKLFGKMKWITAAILLFAMVLGLCPVRAAEGECVADILLYERYPHAKEFQISTPEGLQKFSQLGQKDSFLGKTFYMICDIDMNGFSYVPPVEFAGVFDGGFHAIKRLTVTTNDANCGFVGKVTATGLIRNLGVEAGVFTATCSKDGWRAGSLAGIVEKGVVERCWSSSDVTISGGYDSLSVGGIVGGLHSGGIVKNCYFAGIATGIKVAAGIAGWGQGSSESYVGQIYNCFNMGQLVAETKYAIGRYSKSITAGNQARAMYNNYYFDSSYTEYDWSEGDIKVSRHNLGSGNLARVLDTKSPLGGEPVWSQGALFPELRKTAGVYALSLTIVSKGSSSRITMYLNGGDRYTVAVPESVAVSLRADGGSVDGRTFVMPSHNAALTVTVDAANVVDYSSFPEDELYIVTDAAGFRALSTAVNSGMTFYGKSLYMLCDTNMDYEPHTPIGIYISESDRSKCFSGSFYGNNFKVFNLKVNNTSLNGGGLFGSSYGAYFNGLHIYNGSVTCGNRVGGISGYADACIFAYCTNGASIRSRGGTDGVGGLAGVARMSSVFNYCGNYGTVTATAKGAAGLAGWGQGNVEMTGCFNVGIVTAPSDVAALARVKKDYVPAFRDCYYLKTACDVSVAGSATNLQRFRSGIVASYINTSSRKTTSNGAFTGTPVIPGICTQNQQPAICTRLYSYAGDVQLDYQTICANLGDDLPATNASDYYGSSAYHAPDAVTSYAYPEAVPFYVSYELNGGSWIKERTTEYTRALGLGLPREDEVCREGYALAGWYEEESLTGQPLSVIPPETTGDKTLYAKWAQSVEIGSVEEYLALVNAVNGGNSYRDLYVRLTGDLDFGGATIPALGTEVAPFSGVLDGQGYRVRNFAVNGDDAQGFVGYLKQGTIKFLNVEDATISGKTNTGSLVGVNEDGLIMGCMSSGEVVSTQATYDYTLMCQNVRYARANDASPNSVEERIPRMKTFLKSYDPDIIGFQEYDSVWKTPIESVLTGYDKQLVYGNTPIQEGGTPLYWKSSKFSALEKGTFWLSETPSVISYGWGATHYRTCTYAVLKVKNTDMLIIAANAHLDHEVELARDKGMELIMNRMDALMEKYEAKGYHEIYFHIVGDFNAQPNSNMAKELSKRLTEARYAAVTLGTPVDTNTYSAYKETATSRGDFMFITNNVDVPYYKVALDRINGYAISDHYGLYGELRIGGNSHGGIAGENRGMILGCSYTGSIQTQGGSSGMAGENKGRILNSYSQYSSSAQRVFANAITTGYNNGRVDFCYYDSHSGHGGAGTAVSDLKAANMPDKLNRMVCLWVRREGANGGLPFICRKHEPVYEELNAGEHKVSCQSCRDSYEEAHVFAEGLCACGAKERLDPVLDESLKLSHSLNLASDISINYVVPASMLEGYDMATVYGESTVGIYGGETLLRTTTVRMEPVKKGSMYYLTLTGVTAVQMNDTISTVLYGMKDGQPYCSNADLYSVAQYAYSQLNKDITIAPARLKTICADLLRYGSKAQVYKGYRIGSLADGAMTEAHKAYLSDLEAVSFGENNLDMGDLEQPTVIWAGKSLNLDSKVALKFVFSLADYTGELEALSMKVSYKNIYGESVEVTVRELQIYSEARNLYSFTVDSLLVSELREVLSVRIYEGEQPLSTTYRYSADTYGNNKTGALLDLCKALFAYSDSAKRYFISK